MHRSPSAKLTIVQFFEKVGGPHASSAGPDSTPCKCRGKVKHKMDHLVCFLPALLALGVQQGAVQGLKGQQYLSLAEDLTYTCWKMYSLQPSGEVPA